MNQFLVIYGPQQAGLSPDFYESVFYVHILLRESAKGLKQHAIQGDRHIKGAASDIDHNGDISTPGVM